MLIILIMCMAVIVPTCSLFVVDSLLSYMFLCILCFDERKVKSLEQLGIEVRTS